MITVFTMVTEALIPIALPLSVVVAALPEVENVIPAGAMMVPAMVPPPAPLIVAGREHEYDLAILDLSLRKDEGLAVLQYLRLSRQQLPILIVINRSQDLDLVRQFDLGADDFVLKPFSFSELSARVKVLLRRGSHYPGSMLRVEDLELNRLEHSVRRANRAIELTPKEFSLLEFLMGNSGQPLTRTQIIERVWNLSSNTWTNVVDVYINSLRKKVDATADRKLIHTIRGIGYQLDPGPAFRNYEVQQSTSVKGD